MVLALAFELALNVDTMRGYHTAREELVKTLWNRRTDPDRPEYDIYNWRYILGLPPDFWLDREESHPSAPGFLN